jgi:uncharacterized protein (TIGR03067 family)
LIFPGDFLKLIARCGDHVLLSKGIDMRIARLLAPGVALFVLLSSSDGQPSAPSSSLEGTWEITALIDDGEVFNSALIRERLARDARVVISGQTISLIKPGKGEKKELLFVNDPKASPATLDLAGADKSGGKGIYLLSGDTLMVCLCGPGIAVRPTEFASKEGSNSLLMTLKRVAANAPSTAPAPLPPAPIKGQTTDDETRKMLVGTWGHQDKNKVEYYTLNADETFSAMTNFKRGISTLFEDDVRSSGTWKLRDGVLIVQINTSTDRDKRGQVYSLRVNTISATEVIYIDQTGSVRREWKVR